MVLQGRVVNLSENGGDIAPRVVFRYLLMGLPTVRPGDQYLPLLSSQAHGILVSECPLSNMWRVFPLRGEEQPADLSRTEH